MDILHHITVLLREPLLIALVAAGTFAGVYIGAIPGLSGTMAVSLLVSFTFGWSAHNALALMIGVFVGAVYGGSRPAILFNIPGAPAAVATGFDGYPLAQKGQAGEAMGLAVTQSFIGTLLGIIALAACAPLVAGFALRFRSVDYLMLAFMGLITAGSLGSRSLKRGLIAGAVGLFVGCVGIDPQTAVRRFTFGQVYLNSGVDFVVAMIGLFGAAEALFQLTKMGDKPVKQKAERIIPSWQTTLKYLPLTLRSALLGVLVGALPGAGGDIAALLSYDQARRSTRYPSAPFGEGALEGVIAPETANNAAIGGAFIPMLTLGIPGDAVTAVIISALTVHGLRPGPGLISSSPDMFWLIVGCLVFAAFFLLLFGLTGIRLFSKLLETPKGILMPVILVLSVIGAFAIRNSLYDILWMFGFALAGYFLKRYDYPVAPVVLGIILCPLLENNYRRGVMLAGSLPGLFASVFGSLVSFSLFVLILFLLVSRTKGYRKWRGR
ncbi:MAG: tripartite tricarboxylate transporter permease [Clostridiales bacterium]|nr:tripartite tricarboxylate transporter permease [Clostridiales bacterium]